MKVSCIMPCSRPEDLPRAIEVFLSQDWKDKELIVVNSFYSLMYESMATESDGIYIFSDHDESIGEKRNIACNYAEGDIIINFDSDDFYAPDFITRSVNHLIQSKASITGLRTAYFYRPHTDMWLYSNKATQAYVIGSGMCYYKSVWERKPFPDINMDEDRIFQTNAGLIVPMEYQDGFIAMIHGKNTSSHLSVPYMKRVDLAIAKQILGESYYLYPSV